MGQYSAIIDELIARMVYHVGTYPATADIATDRIIVTAHGMLTDTALTFHGSTPPLPIVIGTTYYARDITANSFKLALTPGGAAIDLSTAGENLFIHVPGRILDGLTFYDKPTVKVDGLTDFPFAMLALPGVNELLRVGARGGYIGGGTMALNIGVRTARELGIPAWAVWVEKVMDAIETARDGSGRIDTNLGDTSRPFTATLANSFVLDLSLTAQLTVTVQPEPMHRGARRTS